ncbi:adenine deaminase [Parafilimonas sp.]|uniref:adenine deaminase n=1 Tax=Parafilimonas sp. TaxID=1969739 RepID=UPI003F7F260F
MPHTFSVKGNYVNIKSKTINEAAIFVEDSKIVSVEIYGNENKTLPYILPGFIDSHVHVESSMLVPSEFARLAVVHGTVATVSDPHEIANVCGIKGVEFMIANGREVNFKFNFGAPSCVPATIFETAGAALNSQEVKMLLEKPEVKYLSEMMNFPGVLTGDDEVMKKIAAAKKLNKPVDGHAPGLRGEDAKKYIEAGISTDHECFTKEEALDKLKYGMKIIIREGSAAKNFEALIDLLNDYPNDIMFCSDDKHPDSLAEGHINKLCEGAVAKGIDTFKVLQAACINPVEHYKLDVGLLNEDDEADFILVKDLISFHVIQTYINGELVAAGGHTKLRSVPVKPINNFSIDKISENDLKIAAGEFSLTDDKIPVIVALDGQLITNKLLMKPMQVNNELVSDVENDILKIVVVNRYSKAPVAKAFIKNMGLKSGAIASSVAHDSHNIVAVGCDDKSLTKVINLIIEAKGGVSCVDNAGNEKIVALPVAGLMSADDGYKVAAAYTEIDKMAKTMGSNLSAPFMTLSFMALLVIPHIKLSDKGLFNGDSFSFF